MGHSGQLSWQMLLLLLDQAKFHSGGWLPFEDWFADDFGDDDVDLDVEHDSAALVFDPQHEAPTA